jgi:hypothetical protein
LISLQDINNEDRIYNLINSYETTYWDLINIVNSHRNDIRNLTFVESDNLKSINSLTYQIQQVENNLNKFRENSRAFFDFVLRNNRKLKFDDNQIKTRNTKNSIEKEELLNTFNMLDSNYVSSFTKLGQSF